MSSESVCDISVLVDGPLDYPFAIGVGAWSLNLETVQVVYPFTTGRRAELVPHPDLTGPTFFLFKKIRDVL